MARIFRRNKGHARIKPNQRFLHEQDVYEPGKVYSVDLNLARYFARNGWLEGSDPVLPTTQALEIDDSVLGHEGGPK